MQVPENQIDDCIYNFHASGILIFSGNYSKFQWSAAQMQATEITYIREAIIPFDFDLKLQWQCFVIINSKGHAVQHGLLKKLFEFD